ncbi:MAG: DUF1800 domain-containing protein [Alphaproteobacteria bacterium]|nr:DUF1800 domain-containing protein [Alphaproteobacteria bacterium]
MLRRSLLTASAALLAARVLPRLARADAPGDRQILHVLDRLAFGPTRSDVAHVRSIGVDRYIAEQLDPQRLPEPAALTQRLAALTTQNKDPVTLFVEYGPLRPVDGVKRTADEQKARRQRANIIAIEARWARIWRALYSPRQLHEVMVDFWFNHFNIFAGKGLDHLWVGAYENEAIRPNALGRFQDLVLATARHPAMLFYLDNYQNTAPGFKTPDGRELGLNENYARELMELHTLGVDGGYSQDDVITLARILTGWSLPRPNVMPRDFTGFEFYPARHDTGSKRLLGHDFATGGEAEGAAALTMLSRRPATALHVSRQLVEYFVSDSAPPALVERVSTRFQQTDGDIRAVLQTLFTSAEFRGSAGGKYKSPYRYVLSAARAARLEVNNPRPLLGAMAQQGQPLYGCVTPDGFRDSEATWLSPDATLLRVGFATALGAGKMPVGAVPVLEPGIVQVSAPATSAPAPAPAQGAGEPVDAAALEALLAPGLSSETRTTIASAQPELRAALLLGSPDFMRR